MKPMTNGIIFDLRRFSIHDGPGIRTTVFLKGCPLDCWWCHNPESQSPKIEKYFRPARCIHCMACLEGCPEKAITEVNGLIQTNQERCTLCGECAQVCYSEASEMAGQRVSVEYVLAEIKRDLLFYDESGGGATLSGGEPLMQAAFTQSILQACREEEIHTALDTSGFAAWEIIDRIRPFVNLFLYDLKLLDDAQHRHYTGVSNRLILDNLQKLSAAGHAIHIRIPIIPGVNDSLENLQASAEWIARLKNIQRVDLLPYHNSAAAKYERLGLVYRLPDLKDMESDKIEEIVYIFSKLDLKVHSGG
jgi:pyruvate formate lyase activating enzyme